MSNDILTKFDSYIQPDGPAALVIREHLIPVEGADGVFFPATYAAGDGFAGGYNIDGDDLNKTPNGKNIALVDSVGAQSNRIEPLFTTEEYKALVPQIVIEAGEKNVNLLEVGHRAGDAIVRSSELQQTLQDAFKESLKGDVTALAKIAPTSLVFGVWDSRDTQAKLPRLIASTIRAYNVRKLTRSAQYIPAAKYVEAGLLEDPGNDKKTKDAFSSLGFLDAPATATHGGVIAEGGIRRDATLALAALGLVSAGTDANATQKLRRYILGLALVAFTKLPLGYIRQGTILVSDSTKGREFIEVKLDGTRTPVTITHEDALAYAKATAAAFGVGASKTVKFDKEKAKKDIAEKVKKTKKTN